MNPARNCSSEGLTRDLSNHAVRAPLHFKLGQVIPVDLLTRTDVKVGDYNQHYDHEQCKGPDQDLCALRYSNYITSSLY